MDLVCLILWIIDLFKPSIGLSVAVITTGVIDLLLLCMRHKDVSIAPIAYAVSIIGVVIGIIKIITL